MECVNDLLLPIRRRITGYGHGIVYPNTHSPMDARLFPLREYSKEVARNTCVRALVANMHFCFSKSPGIQLHM